MYVDRRISMSRLGTFDIIGPIMIGPSSSHTAGAARIGFACSRLIKDEIDSVVFYLHGSFAKTYKGHGTDRALLAGVMGYREDSEELRDAFNIADLLGIKYSYKEDDLGDVHPNTVKIVVMQKNGITVELIGSSIGGGSIRIIGINNVPIKITGDNPVIMAKHNGAKGIITAIALFMNKHGYDIKFMSFYKSDEAAEAGIIVVEVDRLVQDQDQKLFADEVPGIVETYVIQ